jgi:undecaprenyl-diphosphatase
LHYPIDILSGYIFGFAAGFLMYRGYKMAQQKYFPQ